MRKEFLFILFKLSVTSTLSAQFIFSPKIELDTLRKHPSPDSMYAKVFVNIRVMTNSEKEYKINKVICKECDSILITKIKVDAINEAKKQTGLKPLDTKYGISPIDYIVPFLFSLQKNGK